MADPVRVQIYTMQSAEEALAVAALGVDHVGVTPADIGLPGEVTLDRAAEICVSIRDVATAVALTVTADLDAIEHMVQTVQPDILHLCGPPGALGPEAVATLRRTLPRVPVMQAIAVTGPDALGRALAYEPVADYLILDSVAPGIAGIGAAGAVHDWDISAAIVESVDIPVILAGGLGPDNVAAAIEAVRPWGVDSLTHTNQPLPDGGFRKNIDRVGAFVAAARAGTAS